MEHTLAGPEGQSGHGPHPVCQWDTPSLQRIWHGMMGIGQFIVHTYHANINVGLLNPLSPDAFSAVKMGKNVLVAQTLLGELNSASPDCLAGLRGRRGKGKGGERRKEGERNGTGVAPSTNF